MPRLTFSHRHSYGWQSEGITLPIVLKSRFERVDLLATIDTGASNCLFERAHGEMLNLEVEAGEPKTFWTANGRVETFGPPVQIEFAGITVDSMVYFFADERIRKNLLGRAGWLDRLRVGWGNRSIR